MVSPQLLPTAAFRRHNQLEMHVSHYLKFYSALNVSVLGLLLVNPKPVHADEPNPVTAIDILLEPDATMIKKATSANERLLKNFPKGFALGKTHHPHISCLQRYVKTAYLDKVYEAVDKVVAEETPTSWTLKAYKYYYLPGEGPLKGLGLAGIVMERTDDLIRYQRKLTDAVEPFTVKTGTAAAFVTTKEEPDINHQTIDYVANYVPNEFGQKFNPHVTVGFATEDYLKKMLEEKFEEFTFSPVGVAVYHLGNNGTARKKLKGW
jgi:hypothetical protein